MSVRDDLRAGRTRIGVFLSIPSPDLAEMLGAAGFDFVLVDVEHGAFSARDVTEVMRGAAAVGTPSLVRLPVGISLAAAVLDAGASGVQLTGIDTAAEAGRHVRELRYPPAGTRGFSGYTRAARYGLTGRDELLAAEPLVGVQIESPEALDQLPAVAAVEGLDLLFFGPVDFAVSSARRPERERVPGTTARRAVVRAARENGKVAGSHARTLDEVADLVADGFRYVTVSFANVTAQHWRSIAERLQAEKPACDG